MSKMKKLLAMFLALAMVLGMSLTTFAADVPKESDVATVSVTGLETSLKVYAYQIVDGYYNESGFVEYVSVSDTSDTMPVKLVAEPLAPTSAEVFDIAKKISAGTYSDLTKVEMKETSIAGTYSADLNAGYWVVLASGGMNIYNPMLVSAWYSVSGSDNTLKAENVTATDNWTIEGTNNVVAKSDDTRLTKAVNGATWNLGDTATYTVSALIPQYSDAYAALDFVIKDSVVPGELEIDTNSIKVYVNAVAEENLVTEYEEKTPSTKDRFEFDFDDTWVKENANNYVMIVYNAQIVGDVYAKDAHDNKVTLTYTNAPSTTKTIEAVESVYTFQIDGLIQKVKEVKAENGEISKVALPGAEFTLYTDAACTNEYRNGKYNTEAGCVVKSAENGNILIQGLNEGVYYLKETKAPTGYSISNTVFKIIIKATANDPSTVAGYSLNGWTVTVIDTSLAENNTAVNTYNANGTLAAGNANVTQILNTKIVSLPSTGGIGTTIFTVAGCGIMIAAAYLFFNSRRREEA